MAMAILHPLCVLTDDDRIGDQKDIFGAFDPVVNCTEITWTDQEYDGEDVSRIDIVHRDAEGEADDADPSFSASQVAAILDHVFKNYREMEAKIEALEMQVHFLLSRKP